MSQNKLPGMMTILLAFQAYHNYEVFQITHAELARI